MSRLLFLFLLAIALFDQSLGALPASSPTGSFTCPVSFNPVRATYRCISGSQLTLRLPYFGVAPGTSVSLTGPGSTIIGGDDPATVADGTIQLINLSPASTYVVTLSGASCMGPDAISYNFTTPNYTCGNDLTVLINEVLPEPGSDANGDGVNNYLEEQFVEIFNPDPLVEIDLEAWRLRIGTLTRFTFPPGAVLGPRQAFVVFGGGTITDPCHFKGFGFLNISANGDMVSIATPTGGPVHSMTFLGTSFPPNVSLSLNPDGITAGGFVPHTSIVTNPVNYSPCFSNHQPGVVLPVTLTSFTADHYKGKVLFNWATAREVGHDYFSLERSVNGRDWEDLAVVYHDTPIVMAENEGTNYVTEDPTPPTGQVYYRLRQTDLDGTSALYGPLGVVVPETTTTVSVYPNPARNQIWVNGPTLADKFSVVDVRGKEWLNGSLSDGSATSINTSHLPAGIYLLRAMETNRVVSTRRWVKH